MRYNKKITTKTAIAHKQRAIAKKTESVNSIVSSTKKIKTLVFLEKNIPSLVARIKTELSIVKLSIFTNCFTSKATVTTYRQKDNVSKRTVKVKLIRLEDFYKHLPSRATWTIMEVYTAMRGYSRDDILYSLGKNKSIIWSGRLVVFPHHPIKTHKKKR